MQCLLVASRECDFVLVINLPLTVFDFSPKRAILPILTESEHEDDSDSAPTAPTTVHSTQRRGRGHGRGRGRSRGRGRGYVIDALFTYATC